jgi:hypothetical protein
MNEPHATQASPTQPNAVTAAVIRLLDSVCDAVSHSNEVTMSVNHQKVSAVMVDRDDWKRVVQAAADIVLLQRSGL